MTHRRFAVRCRNLVLAPLLVLAWIAPAAAHHPGADLDRVMGSKEKYFQLIDRPAPTFELMGAGEKAVSLDDFRDKVVVLHFVYASCPDVCPLHAEKLADVQNKINLSPMKDKVQFVTITTDPEKDTADVLAGYGPAHGFDPANWAFLTTLPGQAEDSTRALAGTFGHSFTEGEDGYQTHGVVTHVIDRGGRWAANFHGLRFASVNMVLYINGLINNAAAPKQEAEPGMWDWVKDLF
jgi:protein SCO1/2